MQKVSTASLLGNSLAGNNIKEMDASDVRTFLGIEVDAQKNVQSD